tara:strand:- start:285 stop:947 length:663 start_codon:yes stop_codon:yes gene_type:complete
MENSPVQIDYFSDILCVWAWISQRRLDELINHFGSRIVIRYQFIDIFGDTRSRIENHWSNKGSYNGFADHVINSATPYESATVSTDVWHITRPTTSANAHLTVKAVALTHNDTCAADFTKILRRAFFIEAKDISNLDIIYSLAKDCALDLEKIQLAISSGAAMAALMCDYQNAKEYGIKGSPCFVMNEGRQILFGNVGYRALQTNIDTLINHTDVGASWC